jgi:hypothetical protein
MKTSGSLYGICIFTLVVNMMFIGGCSKERTDPKEQVTNYNQMNDYYDTKKQKEQEFEINSSGEGPIIGNQGSKIWGSKDKLMYPNGDSVQWPFTIKLVELYKPIDMIYYQMPTVSGGVLLTTGGEIRLRAFKDDQELVLRPNETWTVEMPNKAPLGDMKIYYGVANSSFIDWTNVPAGNFNVTSYGYSGEVEKLGWVSAGKTAYNAVSTTSYLFTSSTDNLQNVSAFIYLPNIKSLMQVYDQNSGALPIGEDMKIILMGINGNNQLFSYFKDTLVSTNNHINVKLDSISDADLTLILKAL